MTELKIKYFGDLVIQGNCPELENDIIDHF